MNKKTIILNVLLILGAVFSIVAFSVFIDYVKTNWSHYDYWLNLSGTNQYDLELMLSDCIKQTIAEVFVGLTALICLASLVIIDLPIIKKLTNKKGDN